MEVYNSSFLFLASDICTIPYFQRTYVWGEDNWKKLLENITNSNSSHFLGSIILQKTDKGDYLVIDGQQRLTTICILLKACCCILDDDKAEARINYNLFHAEAPGVAPIISDNNLTLNVNHVIERDFNNIVLGNYPVNNSLYKYDKKVSNIVNCYNYFCGMSEDEDGNLIQNITKESAQKIIDLLLKIQTEQNKDGCIVRIVLEKDDNAQRIFDTINAEGVRLTTVDIIKNNLFSVYRETLVKEGKNEEEAFNIYTKHWEKIFEDSNVKYWDKEIIKLFNYIGTILKIYDQNQYNEDELDKAFKEYIQKLNSTKAIENFIEEILNIAILYKQYIKPQNENKLISWLEKERLNTFILSATGENTLLPYVIKTYFKYVDKFKLNVIDENCSFVIKDANKLHEDLHKINTIAIRFYLCKDTYKKVKNFNKKIIEVIDSDINEFGKNLAFDNKGNNALLDDDNFKKGLLNITDNNKGKLALFLIELFRRSNSTTSPSKNMEYNYSLEHIIAQEFEKYWGVDSHPAYRIDEKTNSYIAISDKLLANETRLKAIYEIGNMLLLTGSQNASESNKYITFKVESSNDVTNRGSNNRWCSYETCNDLRITHEVVEIYKANKNSIDDTECKERRNINELWDERDVGNRSLLLIDELTSMFSL